MSNKLIVFLFITVFIFSCNVYRVTGNKKCVNRQAISLTIEKLGINKKDLKKIDIDNFSGNDSLCIGLFLVNFEFKDRTGIIIPVLVANKDIFVFDQENEKNKAYLDAFKKLAGNFIPVDKLNKIERRYLDGILRHLVI